MEAAATQKDSFPLANVERVLGEKVVVQWLPALVTSMTTEGSVQ